ncbi:unnamed protein product [Ophioblennius macclurei]
MSATDGARSVEQDEAGIVVQIYLRVSQNTDVHCPLLISSHDTTRKVVHSAVFDLGLDSSYAYRLLEVRENGGEERPLEAGEYPLERVLLWPPQARKLHPRTRGYYFVLQQQPNKEGEQAETKTEEYDDLCDLPSVTEQSVLEALRQRFENGEIYTYASNVLFAVNPNKFLPVYYNPKYVKKYENQPLGKHKPHIFAIAAAASSAMLKQQTNQCIVISGEGGSGKTESSNYLIHCLTAFSQKDFSSRVERTILGAGPVLEAFGNARTADNNNSSRFGRFIRLKYLESGVMTGAVIDKYLLEKSRLVSRDKSERNFHVFYYLLMGASRDEQEEFHLLKPQDYLYLKQDNLHLDQEKKLGHEYKRLHQAMEMVGFLPSTKKHVFSVLSAILYLGNVTYTQAENSQDLEVGPPEVLSTLSDLLKVKEEQLVNALTKRKVVTVNATVVSRYTLQEAILMRDCMAKSLYSALFDWMVFHINHAMFHKRDVEESAPSLSIGVLDMYGFQNLDTNSFEQLCINYTNETLRCYINHNIFTLEQEKYLSEGIGWEKIEFTDNSGCIQLISAKPFGLLHLLDDESNLPQGADETLLDRLKQQCRDNPFFVPSSNIESTFVIKHFAGRVKYHIKDFLKKNLEHMRPEVISLLRGSERSFLHHLAASSPQALFRWGVLRATIRILTMFKHFGRERAELLEEGKRKRKSLREMKHSSNTMDRLSSNSTTLDFSFDRSDEHPLDVFEDIFDNYEKRKKSKTGRQKQVIPKNLMNMKSLQHVVGLTAHSRTSKSIFHPHRKTNPLTASAQFQVSLGMLKQMLERAEPFFIFCFRSNAEKKEMHFDKELVQKQIRSMGIQPIVQMQKSSFTDKYPFEEFLEKFWILLPRGATAKPEEITELFKRLQMDESTYRIGKTKIHLKRRERRQLQVTCNKVMISHIITVQRLFRGCLVRFQKKKKETTAIEEEEENDAETAAVIQRSQCEMDDKNQLQVRSGRGSLSKRELTRQGNVDVSPNRMQQKPEGRALNRPFSVPLDTNVGRGDPDSPSKGSSLQRYTAMEGIKEKAVRWKEKNSDGEPSDKSSPDVNNTRHKRDEFVHKGKSMSADELSRVTSSDSDGSPLNKEFLVESDGSRFSLPARGSNEDSEKHDSSQSPVTTPERVGFLSKFLRWRPPKTSPSNDSASHHSSGGGRSGHNPHIRISRATRTLNWDGSLDREINDPNELRHLDEFLGTQVNELSERVQKLSLAEKIFLDATMQFRDTIKGMYSVQKPKIAYKDLMKGYHSKVSSLAGPKAKDEVSLVINLFQSVLDGFIRREKKRLKSEPIKSTKKRRKKDKCPDNPLDHRFNSHQVSIVQSCDLCGRSIWEMEKAYMCSVCKLICHKKCLRRIITSCSTRCARQDDNALHFGVQVNVLTSKANPVPKVVELLLMHVEINGLYTEGLYRKSGSACRARELHQILETDPECAILDDYPIHTITGLLKRWLRELPDPLMTFSLYSDFLHAVELPEKCERIRAVYQKVDELPPANYNTLERLIFHLVRVAKEEEHNKMSSSALAIVFAPCILRSPDFDDPFLGMRDVAKTTSCVEILISEQMRRYNEKMQSIKQLEDAEAQAVNQLKLRRQNTVIEQPSELNVPMRLPDETDERTLIERIKSIKQEKVDLAITLPDLEQEHSDDNLDSSSSMSTESLEDRTDSVDSEGNSSPHSNSQKPKTPYKPPGLWEKIRTQVAQRNIQQNELLSGPGTDDTKSSSSDPGQDGPSSDTRTTNGSFDHLDIPYIDDNDSDEDPS